VLALHEEYHIPWHEREHGQLVCDRSAKDIIQMLLSECRKYAATIQLNCRVNSVEKTNIHSIDPLEGAVSNNSAFIVKTSTGDYEANSLVIATGGLSVSKMGATDFGLRLAKQFGLHIIATRP